MSMQFKAGVIGNRWSQSRLAAGIWRQRGKCGAGSPKFAKILGEKLQQLADKRWARAIKGQRVPTPKQSLQLVSAISSALETAQSRCSARTMSAQDVILAARDAAENGIASRDGGTVTCGSYGYAWSTTTASASRQADGTVKVSISRSASVDVTAPAKHWTSVSAARDVLAGGGTFAIRRPHGWDCYDTSANLVGVAIPVSDQAVVDRWSKWEHGQTVAAAQAEIDRKQAILAAELVEAKRTARLERAARLLARLGTKIEVGYDDARAVGACEAGIRAFAERNHLALDSRLPLAQIAAIEPTWAVKLARRILLAQQQA